MNGYVLTPDLLLTLSTPLNNVDHIPTESLERYAIGNLPATKCASLEEHLLTCDRCRDRLEDWDEFVATMRSAWVESGQEVLQNQTSERVGW
jgi:anti-sigma factor RsiW